MRLHLVNTIDGATLCGLGWFWQKAYAPFNPRDVLQTALMYEHMKTSRDICPECRTAFCRDIAGPTAWKVALHVSRGTA